MVCCNGIDNPYASIFFCVPVCLCLFDMRLMSALRMGCCVRVRVRVRCVSDPRARFDRPHHVRYRVSLMACEI